MFIANLVVFICWTLQKQTLACTLTDIKDAIPSACTSTEIDIYKNVEQNNAMEWVQLGLGLASNINTGAAIVTEGVGFLLDAMFADSTDALNVEFQAKINAEFDRLKSCITEQIELNEAQLDEDDLLSLVLRFDEMINVNEHDFAAEFKDLLDDIRDFIKDNFIIPSNTLLRFTSYLPIFRALINFYDQALMTHLTYLFFMCDETDPSTEVLCARFDEYKTFGIDDAGKLISWVNDAYSTIKTAYTPDIIASGHSTESCFATSGSGETRYCPACTFYPLIHKGVSWDSKIVMEDWKLKITTPKISQLDCAISSVSCPTHNQQTGTLYYYERITQECCTSLKGATMNAYNSIEGEINQWSTNFGSTFILTAETLRNNLQNIDFNYLKQLTKCSSNYFKQTGDIAGWGQVDGVGGGASVADCHECGDMCTSKSACKSYECSASELKCNLNNEGNPSSGEFRDYMFCTKKEPLKCTSGYPTSTGTRQEKCENGNALNDGFYYAYNEGRDTDLAVCGKNAGCWCCKRPKPSAALFQCIPWPDLPGVGRQKCEGANKFDDGHLYLFNIGRGTSDAVCGENAQCWCCRTAE